MARVPAVSLTDLLRLIRLGKEASKMVVLASSKKSDPRRCPKCEGPSKMYYQAERKDVCGQWNCKQEGEHLHCECTRCGYVQGAPCADQK